MAELPEEVLAAVLDRMPVARLAVTDDAGIPDVMPIVFARVGRTLFSPIDGKPKKSGRLARLAHIAQRPAVGIVLDHYAADWRQLWWIRISAIATIAVGHHPHWEAAVSALRDKYPQYRQTPLFTGAPTLIVFESSALRWWAASGVEALRSWLATATGGVQSLQESVDNTSQP